MDRKDYFETKNEFVDKCIENGKTEPEAIQLWLGSKERTECERRYNANDWTRSINLKPKTKLK